MQGGLLREPRENRLRNIKFVPATTAPTLSIVSDSEVSGTTQELREALDVPELGLGALEAVWMGPRRIQESGDELPKLRRGENKSPRLLLRRSPRICCRPMGLHAAARGSAAKTVHGLWGSATCLVRETLEPKRAAGEDDDDGGGGAR